MGSISVLELVPLLLIMSFWSGGFILFFYIAWRIMKAVENIAENTKSD
jgi:hypothetical protein